MNKDTTQDGKSNVANHFFLKKKKKKGEEEKRKERKKETDSIRTQKSVMCI